MHSKTLHALVAGCVMLAGCAPEASLLPPTVDRVEATAASRLSSTWIPQASGIGNRINSVWALTAGDVYLTADGGTIRHTADDGTTWADLPSPFGTPAYDIWGTSASNLYVPSWNGVVARWDGNAWTNVGPGNYNPDNALYRVWGSGANDVYAVGDHGMVWHFDGTSWSSQVVDAAPPRVLFGVWGSSARDVYVVGGWRGAGPTEPSAILHFDGTNWSRAQLPALAANYTLSSVWGTGKRDVYAAGFDLQGTTGVILHFDGRSWSIARITPYHLFRLSGSGKHDVLAVGDGGHVLRFDGRTWSDVAVATSVALTANFVARSGSAWIGGEAGTLLHRIVRRAAEEPDDSDDENENP